MEQCEKIQIILDGLKKVRYEGKKIGSATVERDLGISTGFLWKCKECGGSRKLNEEKFKELVEYYKTYVPKRDWNLEVLGIEVTPVRLIPLKIGRTVITNKSQTPVAKKESLAALLGPRGKSNERTYQRKK